MNLRCPHCAEEHPQTSRFCPTTGKALGASNVGLQALPTAGTVDGAGDAHKPHSYPLAVTDASFRAALGLLLRTAPYAFARLFTLVLASVITILWYLVAFGGGGALGKLIHPIAGVVWLVGCLVAFGAVWRLALRYFLHLLKCGHIAVITELVTTGSVQSGPVDMFTHGKRVITERFGEVNVLFAVDALVTGVVRAFNHSLNFVVNLLPLPGLGPLLRLANAVVFAATTYVDETVFSYGLARGDDNPWRTAREGLVYYAQNSKEILKLGVWIVICDKVLTVALWIVFLAPAFAVGMLLPKALAGVGFGLSLLVAVLFAANVRSAFLQPLFLIWMILKFHTLVRDQSLNVEWDQRLQQVSNQFRQFGERIAGYRRPART